MKDISVYHQGKLVSDDLLIENILVSEIGVFETMCVYGSAIFRLDQHLLRLTESAKTVGISLHVSVARLKKEVNTVLKSFLIKESKLDSGSKIVIRVTVLAGEIYTFILKRKISKKIYSEGVCLSTSPVKRSLSNASAPEAKSAAYQNGLLAHLEPKPERTYEWLFLDQNGFVTEVSVGNIFIVSKSRLKSRNPILITPPTQGILNGVTRQFVLECALEKGVECKQQPLTRHEIYNASEAFLTNTSWEILPIRELDRRRVGENFPGKLTQQLQQNFQSKVKRECL